MELIELTTKQRALQVGEKLLQAHGYNGFSFQDVADELGIRKASLYDHFPNKEDLGNRIINNYRAEMLLWFTKQEGKFPRDQAQALFHLFYEFAKEKRFCPVTALAGNLYELPESLKLNCLQYAKEQYEWLSKIILLGQFEGHFRNDQSASHLALSVTSAAFGGQIVARLSKHPSSLKVIAENLMNLIEG